MSGNNTAQGCDALIVGAGPAGLTAACFAAARGAVVALAEREERFPKKLLITGKGRCNVANACDDETFIANIRRGGAFLRSAASAFGPDDVMEFFESRGVSLKIERGDRVFPASDSAADIAQCLKQAALDAGARIIKGRVKEITTEDGAVRGARFFDGTRISCRAAIIATGGLSYPKTGSTGDGLRMAAKLGHTIIPTEASLVPLVCEGGECAEMQGLSLRNVELSLVADGKTLYKELGELLFTHFGVSGPLALTASAYLVGSNARRTSVEIDLKPALDEKTLDRRLLRDFSENLNREFKNSLGALLPQALIPVVVRRVGVSPDKKVNSLTSSERAALLGVLKRFELTVVGTRPIDEAIVTAGGVCVKELDPRSMESKIVKNLHFAGEVIDADGLTGGFNLGIAFATGHAAGSRCLKGDFE